jgi:hypothetical protein
MGGVNRGPVNEVIFWFKNYRLEGVKGVREDWGDFLVFIAAILKGRVRWVGEGNMFIGKVCWFFVL